MNGDGGNELQALVVRRLTELGDGGAPLSYKRAAMRSNGRISHEIIRQIALGNKSAGLADQTIEGLAVALGVDVADVFAALRTPRPSSRWNWPSRFDRLTDPERRLVEDFAAALLNAYDRGAETRSGDADS